MEDTLEAAVQALRPKSEVADGHLAGNFRTAYAVVGRYEEVRASLQRSLSRYLTGLHGHLMLTVVYNEFGQARRE